MEIRLTDRTPGSPYAASQSPWYLTDQHPRSSYGMLVLCNSADDSGQGYGPADIVIWPDKKTVDTFGDLARFLTAADVVAVWATQNLTTPDEECKIRMFLTQWPDGPQLPDQEKLRNSQEWFTADRLNGDIGTAYDH